jgi:xanthosine utilization system XapX-like protein
MAGLLKDRSFPSLFFAAILGIIIGSYLNSAVEMLPGGASVVKTFFTGSIPIGFGDFTQAKPVVLDLAAIKLMLGFQVKFSLLSLVGLIVGLYLFRWYR